MENKFELFKFIVICVNYKIFFFFCRWIICWVSLECGVRWSRAEQGSSADDFRQPRGGGSRARPGAPRPQPLHDLPRALAGRAAIQAARVPTTGAQAA